MDIINDSNFRRTVFQLPRETGALAVAGACREAALHFINEMAQDESAHLAFRVWLSGPYSWLTSYARRAMGPHAQPFDAATAYSEMSPAALRSAIAEAREEVLSVLRSFSDEENAFQFAGAAIVDGLVAECRDGQGGCGWIPVAAPQASIAQRILALIAVDYLAQAEDYESSMCLCTRCARVSFDAMDRARGVCRHHGSGIHVRRIADTWPVAPRETA